MGRLKTTSYATIYGPGVILFNSTAIVYDKPKLLAAPDITLASITRDLTYLESILVQFAGMRSVYRRNEQRQDYVGASRYGRQQNAIITTYERNLSVDASVALIIPT